MRPPVIIVGAHRSGTSATAHALQILGLQIGQKLDSHDEPKPLQRLHEDYLRSVGATWHNPASFLNSLQTSEGRRRCVEYLNRQGRNQFGRTFGYRRNPRGLWMSARLKFGAAWGWKEPRTTLFAAAWLEIFPGARLIHVVRDEVAAAKSIRERELKFRNAGDSPNPELEDLDYCIGIVRTYVEAADRASDGHLSYRLQFEELQRDPRKILIEAAEFCDLRPVRKQLDAAAATIRPWPAATRSPS